MKIKRILAGALACCTAGMLLPVHVFAEENQEEYYGEISFTVYSSELWLNEDGPNNLPPNFTEQKIRFTTDGLYSISIDAGQVVHGINDLGLGLNGNLSYTTFFSDADPEHGDFSQIHFTDFYKPEIIVKQIKIDDVPQPLIGTTQFYNGANRFGLYGCLDLLNNYYGGGTLSSRFTSFDEWQKIEVVFSVTGMPDSPPSDNVFNGDQYGFMFLDIDHPNELTPENPEIVQEEYERRTNTYTDAFTLPNGWSEQYARINADGTYTVSIEAAEQMHGMNDLYVLLVGDLVYPDGYVPEITIIDLAVDGVHDEINHPLQSYPDGSDFKGISIDGREDSMFETWQKIEVTFTVSGMREAEPVVTTTTPETTTTTETTTTAPAAPAPAQPAANNSSAGNTTTNNTTNNSVTNTASSAPKTGDSGTGLVLTLLMLSGTAAVLTKKKR